MLLATAFTRAYSAFFRREEKKSAIPLTTLEYIVNHLPESHVDINPHFNCAFKWDYLATLIREAPKDDWDAEKIFKIALAFDDVAKSLRQYSHKPDIQINPETLDIVKNSWALLIQCKNNYLSFEKDTAGKTVSLFKDGAMNANPRFHGKDAARDLEPLPNKLYFEFVDKNAEAAKKTAPLNNLPQRGF